MTEKPINPEVEPQDDEFEVGITRVDFKKKARSFSKVLDEYHAKGYRGSNHRDTLGAAFRREVRESGLCDFHRRGRSDIQHDHQSEDCAWQAPCRCGPVAA
jgi:hypothetical protein